MATNDTTSSYVELSSQVYGLFVDAFASANQRALEYGKSLYEIVSRPYASSGLETVARENFDRANQMLSVTVQELQTTGQKRAEFAEKLVAQGAKVQESAVGAMRGLIGTGISNMNFIKESTDRQVDELSKRFDDLQNRTTTASQAVSQN